MPDAERPEDDDPAADLFGADGALDMSVVGRRLRTLHELLRKHDDCLDLRADVDRLTEMLAGDEGRAIREAPTEDTADEAIRVFSRDAVRQLKSLSDDEELSRKKRRAAAVGVALAGSLLDTLGFRGHGLADVLLRVTLEETHAHQALVQRGRAEGGLDTKELAAFWSEYPAVRKRFEQAYRRNVARVLDDIDHDVMPESVSIDLAIRGVHKLLLASAETPASEPIPADRVRQLLLETFEDDMLDGGRALVLSRWQSISAETDRDERSRRAAARAALIASSPSPGSEAVYFQAYARAVISGFFHVRTQEEAAAARGAFGDDGLRADGLLAFGRHLREAGWHHDVSRVLEAAYELWPSHDGVRVALKLDAEHRMSDARGHRLGPRYEEGETADGEAGTPDDD